MVWPGHREYSPNIQSPPRRAAVEGDGRATQPKIIIVKVEAEELITVKLADNFGQTLLWTLPVQPVLVLMTGFQPKRLVPYLPTGSLAEVSEKLRHNFRGYNAFNRYRVRFLASNTEQSLSSFFLVWKRSDSPSNWYSPLLRLCIRVIG